MRFTSFIVKLVLLEICVFVPLRLSTEIITPTATTAGSTSSTIEALVLDVNNPTTVGNHDNLTTQQTSVLQPARMVPDKEEDEEESKQTNGKMDLKRVVNFASIGAGAVVLESPAQAKGYSNLLNEDKDKYGISPCSEKKWVVIGLSEDIMVHTVVLANYEKYSSFLRDFQVMGSSSYPVSEWLDLGTYSAEPKLGEQRFGVTTPSWARYLKFRFMSHFGEEFYCTLSQIRVHGSTIVESLRSEVERSDEEVRNMYTAMKTEETADTEENSTDVQNATEPIAELETIDTTESLEAHPPSVDPSIHNVDNQLVDFDTEGVSLNKEDGNEEASGVVGGGAAISNNPTIALDSHEGAASLVNDTLQNNDSSPVDAATPLATSLIDNTNISTVHTELSVLESERQEQQMASAADPACQLTSNTWGDIEVECGDLSLGPTISSPSVSFPPNESLSSPALSLPLSSSLSSNESNLSDSVIDTLNRTNESEQIQELSSTFSSSLSSEQPIELVQLATSITLPSGNTPAADTIVTIGKTENERENEEVVITTNFLEENKEHVELSLSEGIITMVENITISSSLSSSTLESSEVDIVEQPLVISIDSEMGTAVVDETAALINDIEKLSMGIASQLAAAHPQNEKPSGLSTKSRDCYESLRFVDFQAKMRAKMQVGADTERSTTPGPQDNVFRALMQRIKSLEMNNGIIEMYVSQLSDCYRSVLNDIVSAGNASAVAMALKIFSPLPIKEELKTINVLNSSDIDYDMKEKGNIILENTYNAYTIVFLVITVTVVLVIFMFAYSLISSLQSRIMYLESRMEIDGGGMKGAAVRSTSSRSVTR